ncbi:MAG: Fe-S cluster domain-containing protein [Epulopiscium sp.]|nr:Fe-S cluster domain-containing protein [Candidatus Epulonipiscium sp.]
MDVMTIINSMVSIGGLGLLFGVGLGYASKKFAVPVDPKIPLIRDVLPGANCGGCGYAGCDAFAKAVAEGNASPDACPVGGATVAQQVAEILGLTVQEKEPTVAFVKCNGTCEKSQNQYNYYGIPDCKEAALLPGGGAKSCSYGCMGLGSCVKACPFDAIEIRDGIAVVIEEKCTSCGNCVKACPKGLIEIVPLAKKVRVACNSNDKGKDVRGFCQVGCIGCRMCVKACQYDAINVTNQLAHVDYEKCTQCMACVEKCPTKAILGIREEIQEKKAN